MVDVKSLQFLEVALLFKLTSKRVLNHNFNKSQVLWLVITSAQNFVRSCARAFDRCEVAV